MSNDIPPSNTGPSEESGKSRKPPRFKALTGPVPPLHACYRIQPTTGDKRYTLTVPIEIYQDLEKMAQYQAHSLSEEILLRLQYSLLDNESTLFKHWLRRVLRGKLPHSSGGLAE